MTTDAYDAGVSVVRENKPRESCPWTTGTPEWTRGWDEAIAVSVAMRIVLEG